MGGGAQTRDGAEYEAPLARRGLVPKPEEGAGSSVPGRHLGRLLREARAEAGMTVVGAAQTLGCTPQKLARIEGGLGAVRGRDVRAMCELYDTGPEVTAGLMRLAGEVGARGWWHAFGRLVPDGVDLYAGLEVTACRLREYQQAVIPVLLQTRGYATALLASESSESTEPDGLTEPGEAGVSDGERERERVVAARLARQSLLHRLLPVSPRFQVVLSEAVLLAKGFGAAVMVEQLRHLVEVGRLSHVSVRVLPLAAGVHVGVVAGPFVLLEFAPVGLRMAAEPSVVYRESLTGELYLDREAEVAAYEKVWASLDELALDEAASRLLIRRIMEGVGG